jgi:hypothetical protein
MIQATAAALMNQFATALKAEIARRGPSTVASPPLSPAEEGTASAASAPLPSAAKPISGFSLMASVLWNSIRRLFGGKTS